MARFGMLKDPREASRHAVREPDVGGLLFGHAADRAEQALPATVEETYNALFDSVLEMARLRSYDEFSKSVSFSTKMTGWASGANVSACVVSKRGGARVRFEGQAKMRTQINANNAAHRQLIAIPDSVSERIEKSREDSDL
jgi:hypothetical protein